MHPSTHGPASSLLTPLLAGMLLVGCANMSAIEQGTAQGAAIGAVSGVIISAATGGDAATGAMLGGVAGAIGGNIWSRRMEDKQRAMERATEGSGVQVTRTADGQLQLQVPSDISFAVGSAALEPRLRPVLDAFAHGLDQDRSTLVRIVGHTDNTGSDHINDPLSLQRAQTVRSYLEDHGIRAERIEVAGRGSREPVATETGHVLSAAAARRALSTRPPPA